MSRKDPNDDCDFCERPPSTLDCDCICRCHISHKGCGHPEER